MNLPKVSLSRPRFSLRFFVYFLFGLVILILAAEGGYCVWVQQRVQTKNPGIVREEGVFSYVNDPSDGSIKKIIIGVVENVVGDEIIIRADNGQRAKVKFIGDFLLITKEIKEATSAGIEKGTFSDIMVGDEVRAVDIKTDEEGNILVEMLIIIRKV